MMTGDTSDISFLAEFGWYDWVWYWDLEGEPGLEGTGQRSMGKKRLGRYLGPSTNVGDAMCGTVLTQKGTTVDRTTIIPLKVADVNSEGVKKMKEAFEAELLKKLKHRIAAMKEGKDAATLDEEEMQAWLAEMTPDHVPFEQWDAAELAADLGLANMGPPCARDPTR